MILVDANLLLYAYNPSFDRHERARRWFEGILSRPDPVRFTWITILAFLRISTNVRAFEHPLTIDEATAIVAAWLDRPDGEHSRTRRTTLADPRRAAGNDTVARRRSHGCRARCGRPRTWSNTRRDFARFANLRTLDPLS